MSAPRTGLFHPQEIFLVLISVKSLSRSQGHNAAGRIISMKNSNRIRDFPAYSAVQFKVLDAYLASVELLRSVLGLYRYD